MSSVIGHNIKYSLFGESHGPYIGMTIHGFPHGIVIDKVALEAAMIKRKTGGAFTSKRQEADIPEFISGVMDNVTTGAPLTFLIKNVHHKSQDYDRISHRFRPSHADYSAYVKFDGLNDKRGGGMFSGRLTACYVVAGALAQQILTKKDITIESSIVKLGQLKIPFDAYIDDSKSWLDGLNSEYKALAKDYLTDMTADGDSVGGDVKVNVKGLNAGIGNPHFYSLESVLSTYFFSVPGVKAVGFGLGAGFSDKKGSEVADTMQYDQNLQIKHLSNYNGGILGGISNGETITATLTFKPTSSIYKPLQTIDIDSQTNERLIVKGRHDPAFVLRTPIVVESVTAMALLDILKGQ